MSSRIFFCKALTLVFLIILESSISFASSGTIIPRNEHCSHPLDIDVSDKTANDEVPVSLQFRDKHGTRVECSLSDTQSCRASSASEIFLIDGNISRNGLNIFFSGEITIVGCAQVSLLNMPLGHSK